MGKELGKYSALGVCTLHMYIGTSAVNCIHSYVKSVY